ncbi:MAG: DUF2846 domain-containing protein [Deltaproteobacteria bacterium]|nr:DUF2846 domain-containing protein [Deltaproteobacteria bacterium]
MTMSKGNAHTLLIAAIAASFACATPSPAPAPAEPAATTTQEEPAAATAEVPTPAPPAFDFESLAGPNQGVVVFFRPRNFMGGAIRFIVREGERELGKLTVGSYFAVAFDAGPHKFTVHSEAKDELHLEVAAGDVYYVQGTITMGVMVGRPNIAPSNAETFDAMRAKLKESPPLR